MSILGATVKTGDWKGEKHVPVIHAPEKVKKGEFFDVKVNIGEEIPHPNTMEHYIAWIKLFFVPTGKAAIEVADFQFKAHGEGGVVDAPKGEASLSLEGSGKLVAMSYCNIHGLWENSVDIVVE